MENASKALIMAGSVLLSMLVIGALVFMFNSLKEVKQVEATSEEARKLAEYNKKIEGFNRNVYGSEVISLANLIDDYNQRQAGLKDYDAIEITVNIDSGLSDTLNIKTTQYKNYKKLIADFKTLESEYAEARVAKIQIGDITETAEKVAGMRESVLQALIDANNCTKTTSQIKQESERFDNLKKEFSGFKNKEFEPTKVTYHDNGRVKEMIFTAKPATP